MEDNSGKKKSTLEKHYDHFVETGNKQQLLVGLYRETHAYCMRRLSRDPDVVGDFILHLLEGRLDRIIGAFQQRNHPSFPAFYILCVRNSFQNFIRRYRRTHLDMLPLQNDPLAARTTASFNPEEFWQKLEQGLQSLSDMDSLLFKIYHSIPLNSENLKTMVRDFGVERTLEMMEQIEERRRFREDRLLAAEDRMNRFYSRAVQASFRLQSGRRDADVQSYLNRHWAHSIYAVASLLGMSRQLAAFRLRRTTKHLRKYLNPIAMNEF